VSCFHVYEESSSRIPELDLDETVQTMQYLASHLVDTTKFSADDDNEKVESDVVALLTLYNASCRHSKMSRIDEIKSKAAMLQFAVKINGMAG
jgi:hypothetical protein